MNFDQAEREFRRLEEMRSTGRITEDEYRDRLSALRVTDDNGETWMLQERTGQWYVYYGNQWIPATPLGRQPTAMPAAASGQATVADGGGKTGRWIGVWAVFWLVVGAAVFIFADDEPGALLGVAVAAVVSLVLVLANLNSQWSGVIADIREAEARGTADLVSAQGGEALALRCDIADESQVEAMTSKAVEAFGGVDILVANAGISTRAPVHELTLADWERVLRVNLTGTFLCCRAALREMLRGGRGSIVTMGSVQSVVVAGSGAASYKASKAGILMLTRTIAAEYGDDNIRANCVCPGGVDTPLQRHIAEDVANWTSAVTEPRRTYPLAPPIRRDADPLEIANVVAFLASDDASFMTGAAVMVDGGYTAI